MSEVAVRLRELEAVIERGMETFVEVGNAIREIRDSRLYRERYSSFEDYCRDRWGWGRNYANKQVVAADTAALVGTNVPIANEAQARALAPLAREDPEAARAVWEEAVREAARAGRRPTGAAVRKRAGAARPSANPEPPPVPATVLYGGDDPPAEPGALAEAIGGGRAVALSANASVKKAKAFLDAVGRAATEAGREAHLLVYCSPEHARTRAVGQWLVQRTKPADHRRPDPVLAALPLLLPKLAEESSGLSGSRSVIRLLTGIEVAREEGTEPRLALRFGSLRLSIPVPTETVEALDEPVIVYGFSQAYKSAATGAPVRFASLPSRNVLEIEAGSRGLSLYADPTEDAPRYPRASEGEGEVRYAAGDLKRAIDRVLPFVSVDEAFPALTAVFFEGRGGGTRLVATDSYRMILDDTLLGTAPPRDGLVVAGDLRLLSRLLAKSDPEARLALASVEKGGEGLLASGVLSNGTGYELVWRLVDGSFPPYERQLPDEGELVRFGLPAEEALDALRAAQLAQATEYGAPRVLLEFDRGTVTIRTSGGHNGFFEKMDAVVPEGAAVRAVAVNPAYLADALRARAAGGRMAWLGLQQDSEHAPLTDKRVLLGEDVVVMPRHPLPYEAEAVQGRMQGGA